MNCNVCAITDDFTIEKINDLLAEGKTNRQVQVAIKKDFPDLALTSKDIAAHKSHQLPADERILFYFKDGEIYDTATNEVIPKIGSRDSLEIIVTLGSYQILKTGGSRLSARYVVEAAKILAELGQDDTVAKTITEAWKVKLKEKKTDVTVEVTEAAEEETKEYYRKQLEKKQDFLQQVRAHRDDPAG